MFSFTSYPIAVYIASVLGAVALWLMMPTPAQNLRKLGGLLAAVTLGGLWLILAQSPNWQLVGITDIAFVYYYVFSAIAIIAAVRVITNQKPVYSALWFVMVVLASAGLFLVLSAEFMAFAMVIIYGGAILVTYMFVIMLASHAGYAERPDELPLYDRFAREPAIAAAVGFLMLAMLLNVTFDAGLKPNPAAGADSDHHLRTTILSDRTVEHLPAELQAVTGASQLTNVERIGLDLFRAHPLGLELAGVILLVSLIGAVVIAKTQVVEEVRVAGSE